MKADVSILSKADVAVESIRKVLPEKVKEAAQIVIDNPSQFALVASGSFVFSRIMMNLVKPKNLPEALAVMLVCQAGGSYLAMKAVENGVIKFKVRDAHGCLVPYEIGGAQDADS